MGAVSTMIMSGSLSPVPPVQSSTSKSQSDSKSQSNSTTKNKTVIHAAKKFSMTSALAESIGHVRSFQVLAAAASSVLLAAFLGMVLVRMGRRDVAHQRIPDCDANLLMDDLVEAGSI